MTMEIVNSLSDTTAVKIFEHVIIAGIGNLVHVYDIKKNVFLSKRKIINRYKIRGISSNTLGSLLIYGGKEIAVCQVSKPFTVKSDDVFMWVSNDWVTYAKWLECNSIAALSAHNVITIWSSKGQKKFEIACQEQSILYSGYIIGNRINDLIGFAGTVFGEVAIWPVSAENTNCSTPVMHYLKGHKGAIFSIKYDPESNLICTTSDDRSVRWWHKSCPSTLNDETTLHESWNSSTVHLVSVVFGHLSRVWRNVISKDYTFTAGEDSQLCVWKNLGAERFMKNGSYEQVKFPLIARKKILQGGSVWDVDFSISHALVALGMENGSVLLWKMDLLIPKNCISSSSPLGSSNPTRRVCFVGKQLWPVIVTKSGSVWIKIQLDDRSSKWQDACDNKRYLGLCLLESSFDRKSFAVTSSDGSVDVFSGDDFSCSGTGPMHKTGVKISGDYVLSLHWLSDDILLTCRSEGILQMWLLRKKNGCDILEEISSWTLPYSKQRWTTSAAWIPWGGPPGLMICGNRSGDLLLFSKEQNEPLQIIRSLHGQMGVTSIMVLLPVNNKKTRWIPTYHEMYLEQNNFDSRDTDEYLSSAEIYTIGRDGILNIFVLRSGTLMVHSWDKLGFDWASRCLVINSNVLIFGFKGACAVVWGIKERSILLEKDCGGGHRSWDIDFIHQNQDFLSLKLAMVKNGELIQVDWKLPSETFSGNVVQAGLHSKEVNCVRCFKWPTCDSGCGWCDSVLLISGSEDTTVKVSCFKPSVDEGMSILSTISTLHGHLSSVRALAILPLFAMSDGESISSEDTRCDITGKPDKKFGEICTNHDGSHDMLVFSAGGRAQLIAWKLSFDHSEKQRMALDSSFEHCRVKEQYSLLLHSKKRNDNEVQYSVESRFMDLHAFALNGKGSGESSNTIIVVIVAACSDGILRLFGYREVKDSPQRCGVNPFLGLWSRGLPHPEIGVRHCLFKVSHLLLSGRHAVITTDCVGYFHLWDITCHVESLRTSYNSPAFNKNSATPLKEILSPIFVKLTHQFSINSLDCMEFIRKSPDAADDEGIICQVQPLILVASGGEDGALALNLLRLHRENVYKSWKEATCVASWVKADTAPTQISGVKLVKDDLLITVSKCQEVTLWRWQYNAEDSSLSASVLLMCHSAISDIQDIDVVEARDGVYGFISGCGVEVVSVALNGIK